MNDQKLGELEHCVLLVIRRIQPCTAYEVRRAFQTSLTTSWRASTGSIYPLLRKLVANGLVTEKAVAGDMRRSRKLAITRNGSRSLKTWLQQSETWIAEPVADPIRTRSFVLEMLPNETAQHFLISQWIAETKKILDAINASISNSWKAGDHVELRALRGTQLQIEARLKWLAEILKDLSSA
jgi:DNA-binding PadR family transcriptional regulator